jgi:hypothetical protein
MTQTTYVNAADPSNLIYPYTMQQLREDNPTVSFPPVIPQEILNQYAVYPVTEEPKPDYDVLVQYVELDPPPHLTVIGYRTEEQSYDPNTGELDPSKIGEPLYALPYVIGWEVYDKPYELATAAVLNQRKELLVDTDWMALEDTPPITPEWEAYRQALRDVPQQAGYPYNVQWPVPPS